MALVTLCPGCNTTFRIHSAQLQAHGGDVRCGCCQRIFNGFATLITVNESAIESSVSAQQSMQIANIQPAQSQLNTITEDSIDSDWNRDAYSSDRLFDDDVPKQSTQTPWILGNLVLLLLFFAQLTYSYRTELTIAVPTIRPSLERYCERLGCTVPYPQDIKLLGIESSELQKNPPPYSDITTMHATIRNHADFAQALPAVYLLLLDADEQVVTSRIFTASEYLPENDAAVQFIKPQHDLEIRVDFDSSQLNVLGYRVLLLYLD